MMKTKTETLADVMRDLCELAPDRFNLEDNNWLYVFRWGSWQRASLNGRLVENRVLDACQEEIEARGWSWTTCSYDPGEYGAVIQNPKRKWAIVASPIDFVNSPTLAIATALRDALKS